MWQIAKVSLIVLLISHQLAAAEKPDLSRESLARIRADGEKLATELESLQKNMTFLLDGLPKKLGRKYLPEADALSDADKSALSKFEFHKVMVPAFRAFILTLQDEIEKQDSKPASQPALAAEQELRLLRLEVARLREENAQLAGAGADKAKAEDNGPDGDGFVYTRLSFQPNDVLPKLIGEVTNKSGKSYANAIFKVSLYDANKQLLGTVDVLVPNLRNGQSKTFDGFLQSIDSAKIKSYKIQFETGY